MSLPLLNPRLAGSIAESSKWDRIMLIFPPRVNFCSFSNNLKTSKGSRSFRSDFKGCLRVKHVEAGGTRSMLWYRQSLLGGTRRMFEGYSQLICRDLVCVSSSSARTVVVEREVRATYLYTTAAYLPFQVFYKIFAILLLQ